MREWLAILLGKTIFYLSRWFKKGGGFAAPGLYALRVDPNLVNKLTSKIPINIIITGTNVKLQLAGCFLTLLFLAGYQLSETTQDLI